LRSEVCSAGEDHSAVVGQQQEQEQQRQQQQPQRENDEKRSTAAAAGNRNTPPNPIPNVPDPDPAIKWHSYCLLAESSFSAWVRGLSEQQRVSGGGGVVPAQLKLKDEELPGLEVLMCWHAYMLNPRCEFFWWCVQPLLFFFWVSWFCDSKVLGG
jgi:hypothetical protein